jgi:hypothetical protein
MEFHSVKNARLGVKPTTECTYCAPSLSCSSLPSVLCLKDLRQVQDVSKIAVHEACNQSDCCHLHKTLLLWLFFSPIVLLIVHMSSVNILCFYSVFTICLVRILCYLLTTDFSGGSHPAKNGKWGLWTRYSKDRNSLPDIFSFAPNFL